MFGYVKPDLPYLYLKDDKLYKALYCGVCKSIGKTCGQKARLSLTYDIAFLSAFAHNLCGKDVTIKKEHCIVHPLISRPMASRDEITETMACVNVALAYFKVQDDISDEGKGKLKRLLLSSGYKAACKKDKRIAEIVRDNFDLRPAGIIKMLDLRRPIYKQTAAYGHFGRNDLDLPWEKLDKVDTLKKYL
mgnify:CR=1 FL=1